jgi:hypothetical protein
MLKSAYFAVALSLLLLAHDAAAAGAPHGSFSHGFSSHASSSHASVSHAAPAPARAPSGGFGSFSGRAAQTQKSDSALSQQLSKNAAQANALRTLDERNAAKAAQNAPQAAPGYAQSTAQSAPPQPANAPAPGPTTVIVHQDGGGLGHVLAGAMIARSANAHAGYYPPPNYHGTSYNGARGAPNGSGGGFFSVLLTLCLLALIAWGIWFAWRGVRRRRAALEAANKPNYSFERN